MAEKLSISGSVEKVVTRSSKGGSLLVTVETAMNAEHGASFIRNLQRNAKIEFDFEEGQLEFDDEGEEDDE